MSETRNDRGTLANRVVTHFKRVFTDYGHPELCERYTAERLLGCSYDYFYRYLQEQLESGIEFDLDVLTLDHKIPVSFCKSEDDACVICHHRNFQLITQSANSSKGATVPENYQEILDDINEIRHKFIRGNKDLEKALPIVVAHRTKGSITKLQHFLDDYALNPAGNDDYYVDKYGVSRSTLRRWRATYREEIEARRLKYYDASIQKLRGSTMMAVDALKNIIQTSTNEKNIASAAEAILKYTLPTKMLVDGKIDTTISINYTSPKENPKVIEGEAVVIEEDK